MNHKEEYKAKFLLDNTPITLETGDTLAYRAGLKSWIFKAYKNQHVSRASQTTRLVFVTGQASH